MRFQASAVLLIHSCLVVSSFSTQASPSRAPWALKSSSEPVAAKDEAVNGDDDAKTADNNDVYIQGLIRNLTIVLDRWVILRSDVKKVQVENILTQIRRESRSPEMVEKALKLAQQGGFPITTENEFGRNDSPERSSQAEERKDWEQFRETVEEVGSWVGRGRELEKEQPKSALSRRMAEGRDVFMGDIDDRLTDDDDDGTNGLISDKNAKKIRTGSRRTQRDLDEQRDLKDAQQKTSNLVAQSGAAFDGETMGIGGLDDVLAQVKRRIWVPLAAPPVLLSELGISPVRGLLLYGRPGCGKTLIARTIGKILSPCRPVTVVSGPELMDKFVGSSEQNVRKVFDDPPPVYDYLRVQRRDNGNALSKVALHVIIMDEFDAMARSRGGKTGDGNQGEAGVARDSVVNQILAKMDGVDPLPVPTLVIGMTNKRSLIDSALLRPGRFEVQIEVPPPKTQEQRIDILKVHFKTMMEAGRLLVKDAPIETVAHSFADEAPCTYKGLLDRIASDCIGFSGASLAGVARAGASHALERAVTGYSNNASDTSMLDCLVTYDDLTLAIQDVIASSGEADYSEDDSSEEESKEEKPSEPT